MNRLVERMNKFSRNDSEIQFDKNVSKVIEDATVLNESKLNLNSINIINDIPKDLCVDMDSSSIEQVVMNLISNSADALNEYITQSKEQAYIRVFSEIKNEHLYLYVEDNGPGIPKDHQEKVFNSFFTSKESGKGTGLGLSISKQILQMHHGDIILDSNYTEGARFVLMFPIKFKEEKQLAS